MARKPGSTVIQSRKRSLRRILLLIAGSLIFILTTPYVLERWIDSNLDYERIRTQTADAVRERTGLEFTSQGLQFHLIRGIVFNGVRFIEPKSAAPDRADRRVRANGTVLARTENLALHFSVLDYLRGIPPVHTVQMNAGRILPGDRGIREFWFFFQRILQPAGSASKPAQARQASAHHQSRAADPVESNQKSPPGAAYLAPRLRFVARDIQIQSAGSLAYVSGADRIRIDFEASMPDPEAPDATADFELSVRVPAPEADLPGENETAVQATGPLRCRGSFRADGSGRLYFTFTDTPLPFVARMLEGTALTPLRLTTRDAGAAAAVPGLRIQSGALSGDGSFDVYPGSAKGAIGVNFEGRYRRLNARLHFAGGRLIEFDESAGRIDYNGGFELGGDNRHFRAVLISSDAQTAIDEDTDIQTFARARTGYGLQIIHRDIEGDDPRTRPAAGPGATPVASRVDADRFALRGFFNIAQSAKFAGFAPGGHLHFDLSLDRNVRGVRRRSRAARIWKLNGFIQGRDLGYRFTPAVPVPEKGLRADAPDAGTADALAIESLRFDWGPIAAGDQAARNSRRAIDTSGFAFEARGAFAGGAVDLSADGRLELQPTADASLPIRLVSNLELEGRLANPDLARAIAFLRERYARISRLGYDPESRRAEDAGPLWQNQFFESDFYRTIVEGLRARARFEIRGARPAGTLPPELALVGRADNGFVRIESENGFNGGRPDAPEFQLKYESNLQAILPRQDLQLRFRVPNNRLAFSYFTADSTPPDAFDLRYFMGGEGVLPGDLMQRTYSRLEIGAAGVRLGRNRLLDIMRHEAGLSGEILRLERLDLTRSTDGGESSMRIRASAAERLAVEGAGEHLAGIGGSLRLRFRFPDDPGGDRNLRFRIRPDGGYVPEL